MTMRTSGLGSMLLVSLVALLPAGEEAKWQDLLPHDKPLEAWKNPTPDWTQAAQVELDPENPKRLRDRPGQGVLCNGPKGRTRNLVSKEVFGDLEAHVEFLIPKGSNSGVKMHAHYEIQILDSFGKKDLTGDACGGIYPRAELLPRYRHLDQGTPPKVNAARKPGEWQTLDIQFKAPRFDSAGKKIENARFVKVTLNDQVIHENVELLNPTGSAWNRSKEVPTGPLLLQADHGPVAFRNVRVRPLR